MPVERLEYPIERPGLVVGGDENRGLVVSARTDLLVSDHQETRLVVRFVLDLGRENPQPVTLRRHLAGDGAGALRAGCDAGRLRVAGEGGARDPGIVAVEPAAALRQRLFMGVDGGDRVAGARGQEGVMNGQLDLAADAELRGHEAVEGVVDHALGAVLDRYDAAVGGAGFHLAEHLVDGRLGPRRREVTEVLDDGGFRVGAGWAEVGHRQWLLEGQAAGDDFAEQARHVAVREGAGVLGLDALQDLRFPLGAVEHRGLVARLGRLDLGHAHGAGGAVVQESGEVAIDFVDAFPDRGDVVVRLFHVRGEHVRGGLVRGGRGCPVACRHGACRRGG